MSQEAFITATKEAMQKAIDNLIAKLNGYPLPHEIAAPAPGSYYIGKP